MMAMNDREGNEFNRLDLTSVMNIDNDETDLTKDITGNTVVIDDMSHNSKVPEPSRYGVEATDNAWTYDLIRYEGNDLTTGKFVCSHDNPIDARNQARVLNSRSERSTIEAQLTSIVNQLTEKLISVHDAAMMVLSICGYDQIQEFQAINFERSRYVQAHPDANDVPFTLSETFGELAKVNRLAIPYSDLDCTFTHTIGEFETEIIVSAIMTVFFGEK